MRRPALGHMCEEKSLWHMENCRRWRLSPLQGWPLPSSSRSAVLGQVFIVACRRFPSAEPSGVCPHHGWKKLLSQGVWQYRRRGFPSPSHIVGGPQACANRALWPSPGVRPRWSPCRSLSSKRTWIDQVEEGGGQGGMGGDRAPPSKSPSPSCAMFPITTLPSEQKTPTVNPLFQLEFWLVANCPVESNVFR